MIERVTSRSSRMMLVAAIVSIVTLPPVHARAIAGPLTGNTPQSLLPSPEQLADPHLHAAADQLLTLVMASGRETSHYPAFAKERLAWLNAEVRANRLSIVVLEDLSGTNVGSDALMASGVVNGRRSIVILQPRLRRLLLEEGGLRPPFTQRQKNNFMLGLVHEAVHLASPNSGGPRKPADLLKEELRAWWK
jgi:hypothetical protein